MNENIEYLQSLGIEKIVQDTHIPKEHVAGILKNEFSNFTKVQFLGFIAILEREYNLDLTSLKDEGLEFFKTHAPVKKAPAGNSELFVVTDKRRNFTPLYIALATIVFIVGAFVTFKMTSKDDAVLQQDLFVEEMMDTKKIEQIQDTIASSKDSSKIQVAVPVVQQQEHNVTDATQEQNNTQSTQDIQQATTQVSAVETPQTVQEQHHTNEAVAVQNLIFKPSYRTWYGYIDIKTHKKKHTTSSRTLRLDPKRDWLVVFGHGPLRVTLNGKTHYYKSRKSLRFLYKDGKVRQIHAKEFKKYNKGRIW